MSERTRILYVCMGNTKRSRAAEVITIARAERMDLDLEVGSAGLIAPTEGMELLNSERLKVVLKRRGYKAENHRRQQVTGEMLEKSDLVLGMNRSHVKGIYDIAPELADRDSPVVDTLPGFVGYPRRRIRDPEEGMKKIWEREEWKWIRWVPYPIRRCYYRWVSDDVFERKDERAVLEMYDRIVGNIEGYVCLLLKKISAGWSP